MISSKKRARRKVDNFLCEHNAYLSHYERELLQSNTFARQTEYNKSLRRKSRKYRKILRKAKKILIKDHKHFRPAYKNDLDSLKDWETIYWANKLYTYSIYGAKHERRRYYY